MPITALTTMSAFMNSASGDMSMPAPFDCSPSVVVTLIGCSGAADGGGESGAASGACTPVKCVSWSASAISGLKKGIASLTKASAENSMD